MKHASDPAGLPDVMQVCRNGHVITDLLLGYPERGVWHCDSCGAPTIDRCATCGEKIPGAVYVPGLVPAGSRPPPSYCARCGAPFPWTPGRRSARVYSPALLERLLRGLPRVVRELRSRHSTRPAFCVEDEYDLEDLVRALLALEFDRVRPEKRTPAYSSGTRTDFWLPGAHTVVSVKYVLRGVQPARLVEQLQDDSAYYRGRESCNNLIAFIYDPEGILRQPATLERAWSGGENGLNVRCVIAGM
jgi:hypothetical protein